jgi:hypothetical protein
MFILCKSLPPNIFFFGILDGGALFNCYDGHRVIWLLFEDGFLGYFVEYSVDLRYYFYRNISYLSVWLFIF